MEFMSSSETGIPRPIGRRFGPLFLIGSSSGKVCDLRRRGRHRGSPRHACLAAARLLTPANGAALRDLREPRPLGATFVARLIVTVTCSAVAILGCGSKDVPASTSATGTGGSAG